MRSAYIVDVDGTIAERGDRSPFDWKRVGEDRPKQDVINVVQTLSLIADIIIVSGRDGSCYKETEQWLADNLVPFTEILMRPAGDNRKDSIVKREIYDSIVNKYNIIGVFDDRNQVVEMWRSLGLTCFQVAEGDF